MLLCALFTTTSGVSVKGLVLVNLKHVLLLQILSSTSLSHVLLVSGAARIQPFWRASVAQASFKALGAWRRLPPPLLSIRPRQVPLPRCPARLGFSLGPSVPGPVPNTPPPPPRDPVRVTRCRRRPLGARLRFILGPFLARCRLAPGTPKSGKRWSSGSTPMSSRRDTMFSVLRLPVLLRPFGLTLRLLLLLRRRGLAFHIRPMLLLLRRRRLWTPRAVHWSTRQQP